MSTHSGSVRTDRRRRAAAARTMVIATVVAMTATTLPAAAYWGATGSASAAAHTGTLAAPVDLVVPEAADTETPIAWTPGTGGVAPEGYFVVRHTEGAATAACATGPSTLITTTECTDTAVPDGVHSYVVTAVYRTWTAPSAPSASVSVVSAAMLAFTTAPTDTVAGAPITPALTVALQTVDGDPFFSAGVAVALAIATNPANGTVSGVVTATTDADGVATFAGLSIDEPGVGYTLIASSAGLASATSGPFAVTEPAVLDAAQSYSVLAATTVVSTGATAVSGDLGVSPGTSITGFGPGTVGGDIHAGDANAAEAQADLADAYADLSVRAPDDDVLGNLGGRTIPAGIYHQTAAMALTGILTLDAQGDPDAIFIFQTDAAFDTAAGSTVVLTGSAQASNVFWVVAGAAGTGANSFLSGTIVAQGAITLGEGTQLIGRALSLDAVTLASATIRFTEALPPTIAIDGGAGSTTKDTTPTITGTSNATASSLVTVTVNGQSLPTMVGADGTWSVTAAALPAGAFDLVAKVRDAHGNGSAAFQTLTVEVNPLPILLGTTATYSVLAGTGVVSTGATTMTGDLGVSPDTSVTGFPPAILAGTIHAGDSFAATAQQDLLTSIQDASSRAFDTQVISDLGGRTFHAGVHHATAALALTGTLTLDGEGDPDAVFIFRTDAAFNTAAASSVVLVGGAQASNVFWVVAGAAGTGANSSLVGTILATGAITLGEATALDGRALSRGTVTLANDVLTGTVPAPTETAGEEKVTP